MRQDAVMRIGHESIEDSYGLSPMQQGMLFHTLYEPHAGLYIGQVIFDLQDHELNILAFQQSWHQVVARHPSLRTSFHWEGSGAPVQHVHATVDVPFRFEDCRDVPSSEQTSRFDAFLRSDRKRGFTLTEPPLMRLAVFRIGQTHHKCVWTAHHLLADRQSGIVILRELFALYDGVLSGQHPQLPTPRSYREHIAWLEHQDWRPAETFWRKALQGFTAPTPLAVNRPAGEAHQDQQAEGGIQLKAGATAALRCLAGRHLLTLNTFVQGAWALLLSRYSGEEDVLFGTTRACRRSAGANADEIVGLVMNSVPIRVRVQPDAVLCSWLKGLRLQQLPLLKYEHTPPLDVQRWSDVPHGTSLFESVLNFADYSLNETLRGLGTRWETSSLDVREKTNYALTVYVSADPELTLKIAYDPNRFDADTIGRMLGHFKTLLEAMAVNLDQRVRDLPLLTDAEQQLLLVEWNETTVDYNRNTCIHQLFEAQTARTPNRPAMCFEDRWLTYRELNARANQVGHYLRKAGVHPGVKVGICMERSLDMAIALWGILKAGGAYVPLDPKYPKERLGFIVGDAGIEVLLTQERLAEMFADHQAAAICLDTAWPRISQEPDNNPDIQVSSEDLAYLIYTSGSTGKPKGVMVRHRNVVNFFAGMDISVGSDPPGVWLAVTSISFDISVLELFWPLTHGSKVILHSGIGTAASAVSPEIPGRERDLSIPAQMWKHGVTHLQCTPSMARLLAMDQESLRALKPLRKLLLGGEALPDSLADDLSKVVSGQLLNMYGPTETTVWSSTAAVEPGRRPVPIGRPIANTQLYILDQNLHPTPIGVMGELFIGGDGVAAGYHNRPELTAERFVGDPFSATRGRFLYRTGDIARYLPDGNIECLGRVDHQVKIRGHRIELGEIEAVLQQYRGVGQAVVTIREDQPGDQRLIGYVVCDSGQDPTEDELRGYLEMKLPKEMVPAAVVMLDALPRTPNGKLDRRALPAPDYVPPQTQRSFIAPRDAIEKELAAMWERILRVSPIGVRDNFFELGGHSLLAVSLFAYIERAFGKALPLATLFRSPTIEQLARLLQQDELSIPWSALVAIQPHGSKPPLFFMHSGGGHVLEYYPLAQRLGPDQPFYALQSEMLNGCDIGTTPRIEDMAACYIREIRKVQPTGPYFLGGFCLGGYLAYEVAQQLCADGEEVAALAMVQTVTKDYPKIRSRVTFLHRLCYWLVYRFDVEWSNAKAIESKARIFHLVGRAKRMLTLARVNAEALVSTWLACFNVRIRHSRAYTLEAIDRLHVRAVLGYAMKGCPIECVTLFRASKQPLGIVPDPTLGWNGLLNGHLEVHEIPAHHQNILKEPAVRVLAQQLTAYLDRVRRKSYDESRLARKAS
jgi:amino acid adenylation domain-containing protein